MAGEPKLQNMICSTIKIRPAYKISVLYLQNQASYSHFSPVNVMWNLNFTKFLNPEISLKFWDFGPKFCMWPLNIQTNKWYIATWGQRWLLPWYLRGASEAPLRYQASYSHFSPVNVMRNLNFTKFLNPEISLKFWDFGPKFCMWPLNIQTNKWYIATWGQRWLLPWYLRGASEAPPRNITRFQYAVRGRVKALYRSAHTILWSWMVKNFDGEMCNPFGQKRQLQLNLT